MDKAFIILGGEIQTPPMGEQARKDSGFYLRLLQAGETLTMPISRPMPTIGQQCHELRIKDAEQRKTWRIMYRIDEKAILVLEIFEKKTETTPKHIIEVCKERLKRYDQ